MNELQTRLEGGRLVQSHRATAQPPLGQGPVPGPHPVTAMQRNDPVGNSQHDPKSRLMRARQDKYTYTQGTPSHDVPSFHVLHTNSSVMISSILTIQPHTFQRTLLITIPNNAPKPGVSQK